MVKLNIILIKIPKAFFRGEEGWGEWKLDRQGDFKIHIENKQA
jgi:hypothetical protein